MVLKNVIVPTVTYGGEIFGCNELRLKGLKQVADESINQVIIKNNLVHIRVYEELRIKIIGMFAAIDRARAINKQMGILVENYK